MPTYRYLCSKCGHEFDYFQPMSAAPLTHCPQDLCARRPWSKGRVRRQLSAGAGLLFKGSGFYITDYRSESYTRAAKQEAGAAQPAKEGPAKTNASAATPAQGGSRAPAPRPPSGPGTS